MLTVITLFCVAFVGLIVARIIFILKLKKLKVSGIYPANERAATNNDVSTLLKNGHKIEAIRLYRLINKASLAKTIAEVNKLNSTRQP